MNNADKSEDGRLPHLLLTLPWRPLEGEGKKMQR
jgi:hypothetical protein